MKPSLKWLLVFVPVAIALEYLRPGDQTLLGLMDLRNYSYFFLYGRETSLELLRGAYEQLGNTVAMGPAQDTYDGHAVNLAAMFLGINTVDCLLCHDGARHLDTVSLWGSKQTRQNMWGLSAYFARARMTRRSVGATFVLSAMARADEKRLRNQLVGYEGDAPAIGRPARHVDRPLAAEEPAEHVNRLRPQVHPPQRHVLVRRVSLHALVEGQEHERSAVRRRRTRTASTLHGSRA